MNHDFTRQKLSISHCCFLQNDLSFFCIFRFSKPKIFLRRSSSKSLRIQKEKYTLTQQEESQLSVSKVVSNHCGCTLRGVKGVKRSEILWKYKNTHCQVDHPAKIEKNKKKNSKKCIKIHQKMVNGFFILFNFGWMVDPAMSVFEFLTNFLIC